MLYDILMILNLVVALYIWFDTDAVAEWAGLLRLKFLKYQEYEESKSGPLAAMSGKTYTEFLLFKYSKYFFIRLITCPVCFTVWVNLALMCVIYQKVGWIMLGLNVVLSWLLYHLLRYLLSKLNA